MRFSKRKKAEIKFILVLNQWLFGYICATLKIIRSFNNTKQKYTPLNIGACQGLFETAVKKLVTHCCKTICSDLQLLI